MRQTSAIVDLALQRGWQVNSPLLAERRAGHVTIAPPDAERLAGELLQRRVMIDYRPGAGIRLAPHFYTTDAEIELAFAAIDEVVAGQRRARPAQ